MNESCGHEAGSGVRRTPERRFSGDVVYFLIFSCRMTSCLPSLYEYTL